MKILSADQIRELDAYTIAHEPIASVALMERAAGACADWITDHFPSPQKFAVFCGQGNNGGDGLVVSRLLHQAGYDVSIYVFPIGSPSIDFTSNLTRLSNDCDLKEQTLEIGTMPPLTPDSIVIDAIFGSGLNRPLEGGLARFADGTCELPNLIIAIDIPSGVFADQMTSGSAVCADFTLTFEFPKRAFFIPENNRFVGSWIVLPIGLDKVYSANLPAPWQTLDGASVGPLLIQRGKYTHKGSFGHALLVAGSYGMAGAAVLAANAALRSGVGLLTLHVPRRLYAIIQISAPEALCLVDENDHFFTGANSPEKYSAVGIGCGLGTADPTREGLRQLLRALTRPAVIDADALNLMAADKELLNDIPRNSILTPHPREFARLFGESVSHFDRLEKLSSACATHQVIIVLKGAHTAVGLQDGRIYFNTTGNPGMATGGSGDVLTGILTSLLAQGYTAERAAMIGVYLHGLAGDLACGENSQEALIARDIIDNLGKSFRTLISI